MTLDKLPLGHKAIIHKIHGEGQIRRRLMDMGLLKGVSIEVVHVAPMGDPIAYLVRGYQLLLRKSEAILVEVEVC